MKDRQQIYSEIHENYNYFVINRLEELPKEFLLTNISLKNLDWMWRSLLNQKATEEVCVGDLHWVFAEYYKRFRLKHNICPKIFVRMVHKTDGLIRNISQVTNPLDQNYFQKIIEHLIIATFEDLNGYSLLSGELMALLVWNLYTSEKTSFINFTDNGFSSLFETLTEIPLDLQLEHSDLETIINQEFKYFISKDPYNLLDFSYDSFSFEAFKELFLERNIMENRSINIKN